MSEKNFNYLRIPAKKYGCFYAVSEFNNFIVGVDQSQMEELRAIYNEMVARTDSERLSRWIDECFENRNSISKDDFDFSSQIGQLLRLFEYLAENGIQPFASRRVGYIEVAREPNWDNLPEDLTYLIELASEYGRHSSESEMLEFLGKAHPNDLENLATAAERMRLNGHAQLLKEWFKQFPLHKHPEAWMLYCLLGLMDHAGLKFE